MAQKRTRVCLQVERMEPKQLLSSSVIGGLAETPVLTMFRYRSTLAGVKKAVGTVARTHEFNQLAPSLAALSTRLPFGRQQVLPLWNNDLNILDPNIRGSGLAMQRQLLSDTVAYVQSGATEEQFRVIGRGASVFYTGGQSSHTSTFEIDPDPNRNPNAEYYFAFATVKNDTGEPLPKVEVSTKLIDGSSFHNTFGMTGKDSTLLYLVYPSNGQGNGVYFTLRIDGKTFKQGMDTMDTDTHKATYSAFKRDLARTEGPVYKLRKVKGEYQLSRA
jgi:hypothetical protein